MSTSDKHEEVAGHEKEFEEFIAVLTAAPELEPIVSEIGALHSIYGDGSIRVWKPVAGQNSQQEASQTKLIRYEIHVELPPPYDSGDLKLRILVSVPYTYPETSPPQLQVLNRYIGPYKVDSGLFGSVLRTFISKDGVEWSSDNVCVFDGVENVRDRCAKWYGERVNDKAVAELRFEEEVEQKQINPSSGQNDGGNPSPHRNVSLDDVASELPPGTNIFESDPFVDRKSVFVGRACRISDPSQVSTVLSFLLADRRIARATHPIINAWRCRVGDVLHQDNDDDGESAAGARLAHLLQILDLDNVLVVVTRLYGGIQLGPDRFKHINHVARKALEVGGFLDAPEPPSGRKAQARHRKHG